MQRPVGAVLCGEQGADPRPGVDDVAAGPLPKTGAQRLKRKACGISIDDGPLDDLWNQAPNNMAGLDVSPSDRNP